MGLIYKCMSGRGVVEIRYDDFRHQTIVLPPSSIATSLCAETDISSESITTANEIGRLLSYMVSAGKFRCEVQGTAPSLDYTDVTDNDILGFDPIERIVLEEDGGLWTYYGKRVFVFNISNLPMDFLHCFECDAVGAKLSFFRQNDIDMEIAGIDVGEAVCELRDDSVFCRLTIDTDLLGESLDMRWAEKSEVHFSGLFELSLNVQEAVNRKLINAKYGGQVVYKFAVGLNMFNTASKKFSEGIARVLAAIDFGTSSTCVVVSDSNSIYEPRMLSISNKVSSDNNVFENPTNLMLYKWRAIVSKLQDSVPALIRGDINSALEGVAEYDSGYSIKKHIRTTDPDAREMRSILSELKMLPYFLSVGDIPDVYSFDAPRSPIVIVLGEGLQNADRFDPIMLYGYLLGRTINLPHSNRLYTHYEVAYPVRFNCEMTKKICESLKSGLSLALPKPFRTKITVKMTCFEPVAYLCGLLYEKKFEELVLRESEIPFAIYDFGGGTLDYAFGFIRVKDGHYDIHILGTGGDETGGGETLISRISYWIYNQLGTRMVSERIVIQPPLREKSPSADNGLSRFVKKRSSNGRINIVKLNEIVSRKIFENTYDLGDTDSEECLLFTDKGYLTSVKINDINVDDIDIGLEKEIGDGIRNFANELKFAFNEYSNGFDLRKVRIFMAGNACRNKYVLGAMEKAFPFNHIEMPGLSKESLSEERMSCELTPKTMVALGLFRYSMRDINISNTPSFFRWFVGVRRLGEDFDLKISNNSTNDWVEYIEVITNTTVTLQYSNNISGVPIQPPVYLDFDNSALGMRLFLRVHSFTELEYRVAAEKPNGMDASDINCVVALK